MQISKSSQLSKETKQQQFNTPQLNHLQPDDINNIIYTPKMKQITFKILSRSSQRLQKIRNLQTLRKDYQHDLYSMIQTLKIVKPYQASKQVREDILENQIDRKIQIVEFKIEKIIEQNKKMKNKILMRIKRLEIKRRRRIEMLQQLRQGKKQNKNGENVIKYMKYLSDHFKSSQQQKNSLLIRINSKKQELTIISNQNTSILIEIGKISQTINNQTLNLQSRLKELSLLYQQINKLSIKSIPNQSEMINCMFTIGILNQQITIFSFNKKIKSNKSSSNPLSSQQINQFLLSYLFQREIKINCANSSIIHLILITFIYVHCKSITINNLTQKIKISPFASQQFKNIYNFQVYSNYMNILMQKRKGNKEWQNIRDNNVLQMEQLIRCEKKLIIFVKQQYFSTLLEIMQIFYTDSIYEVNIHPYKMIIQLKNEKSRQQMDNSTDNSSHLLIHLDNFTLNP